jgi:hypothetical protein
MIDVHDMRQDCYMFTIDPSSRSQRTHHAYIWFYIVHVKIYRRRSYAEFLSVKRMGQTCICRKPLLIAGNAKAASSTFHTARLIVKAGSIFRGPKWVLTRLDWLFAVSRTQPSRGTVLGCSCCPGNQRHPSSCRCNLFTAARVPHSHTLKLLLLLDKKSNYF